MEQTVSLLLTKLIELAQMLGSVLARVEANENSYSDLDDKVVELQKMEGRLLVLEASSTDSKSGRLNGRQIAISITSVVVSSIAVGFAIYFGFRAR